MTAHVCDPGCKDHADASREQALSEVEQLLMVRWKDAWKDWERLVDKDEPGNAQSIAWGRQSQALEDAEAVAAMRSPDGVRALRMWRASEITDGGPL